MAKADYWCCESCDEKVIYDGDNRIADELASRMNISEKDSWKIVLICHKCTYDGSIRIWYNDGEEKMKTKQYSGIKYIPKDDNSQRMKEEIKAAFDRIKKLQMR